eukprot:CAMPEP_0114974466 /NCGR_PEP_ID=MMETSP0216-20121206/1535_1 /TAXON_ID=223996 /ORGANISM="Protocruzia adherens, Strain Boccale" /LENGTH=470 /DNA_ID=CAMNT_0002335091 /DNA_START=929 /DNA_END=2341 /DNA_ORIENTATION=-
MSIIRVYDPQIHNVYKRLFKLIVKCELCRPEFRERDVAEMRYEAMCEDFEDLEQDDENDMSMISMMREARLSDNRPGINQTFFDVSQISEDDFSSLQTSRNFYISLVSILGGLHKEAVTHHKNSRSPHFEYKLKEFDIGDWLDMRMFHYFQVKVKLYYPEQFEALRMRCGISFNDLRRSLDPISNVDALRSAREGAGKSGSFFLFTSDMKFILKVVTDSEVNGFLRITKKAQASFLDDFDTYFDYLEKNRDSLLAKVLGIYRIRHAFYGSKVYILLMENIQTPLGAYSGLQRTYDLKGSTFDRTTLREVPNVISQLCFEGKILKDNDFLHVEKRIYLPDEDRKRLFQQIERDLDFLESCRLMDYSLLMTIRVEQDCDATTFPIFADKPHCVYHGYTRQGSNVAITFGIIDYFQIYTHSKKLETVLKATFTAARGSTISSQAPDDYAKRFLSFMKSAIRDISDEGPVYTPT